jgi:hypothetical protein
MRKVAGFLAVLMSAIVFLTVNVGAVSVQQDDIQGFDYATALEGRNITLANDLLQEFEANNPTATYDEKLECLFELIQNEEIPISFNTFSASWASYLPSDTVQLNSQEQAVFNSNPLKGLSVLLDASFANDATPSAWSNANGYHNPFVVLERFTCSISLRRSLFNLTLYFWFFIITTTLAFDDNIIP